MARIPGNFDFPLNFEGLLKGPIDAKQLVGTKADLTGATTWNGSGQVWLYDGAIVSVAQDPIIENNGIYFLASASTYTDINSWEKVGSGGGTTISGTTAYLPMFTTGEDNIENSNLFVTHSCVGKYLQTNICALGSCNPNKDFAWNFGNDCTCYLHLCYGTGSWSGPRLAADTHTLSLGGSYLCLGADNCIIINVSGDANNNLTIKGGNTCNSKYIYCLAGDDNNGDYGVSVGIQGGDACPLFNADGGDVVLTPGLKAGTGVDGRIILDGLPACTTETNIIYVDANGALSSGATSGGATDLSIGSSTGTVVRIDSSTGTNATLPLATASLAGVVSNTTQTFAGAKTFNDIITTSAIRTDGASTDYNFLGRASNGYALYVQIGTATGDIATFQYDCMSPNSGLEAFKIAYNCTKTTGVACATTSVDTPLVNVTTTCSAGDMIFCNGATRNIYVETSSSGIGQNMTICGGDAAAGSNYGGSAVICGAVGGCSSSSPGTGGNSATLAGQGGENTAIGQGGTGGRAIVRAGCGGCTLGGQGGDGGQAELCGGQGYPAGSGCGAGGDVKIQSGCGTNAGCVMIYHGATLRMNSTTTGMYTNGVHCASTCVCSPVFCATTAFRATGAGARFCGGSGCGYALDWISSSDCRIKKCIEPITSALSTVDALCGVYYELCEDNTPDMGLIAQDVFKVEPRLVSHDEPIEEYKKYGVDDELLGLKYDKFAGLFVEAIKELKAQNICLQNQINELNKIK